MLKRIPLLGFAALAASLAFLPPAPVDASQAIYCAPSRPGVAAGPGRFTAPTSGTTYSLNAAGCARAAGSDIADFVAAGFVQPGGVQAAVRSGITTSSSANSLVVPAGARILGGIAEETSGGTTTGSLKLGTSNGGTQFFGGTLTMPASTARTLSDAHFAISNYTSTADTTIYVDMTGTFGTGAISVTIYYAYF